MKTAKKYTTCQIRYLPDYDMLMLHVWLGYNLHRCFMTWDYWLQCFRRYFILWNDKAEVLAWVLSVLTLTPWAVMCSKRSNVQLDRREVWRQTAWLHCVPLKLALQVWLVPAKKQLRRQWTRDLMSRRWMKSEFSSCKTNTMWPCWLSDCVILVRLRSTLLIQGTGHLNMGKLQSKHGKKCCTVESMAWDDRNETFHLFTWHLN